MIWFGWVSLVNSPPLVLLPTLNINVYNISSCVSFDYSPLRRWVQLRLIVLEEK